MAAARARHQVTRPLIVGEAPGRADGPPLSGRIGRRLADLSGLSDDAFAAKFERVNVLRKYPGAAGKGAQFPNDAAMRAARRLWKRIDGGRMVVLLGKRVARSFGIPDAYFVPWHCWSTRSKFLGTIVVVPHPSGINRWFNDPRNVERMRRFMRKLVQ